MRGKIDFMPMLDILLILFFAAFILAQETESAETVELSRSLEQMTERLQQAESLAASLQQEKTSLEVRIQAFEEEGARERSFERELRELRRELTRWKQEAQEASQRAEARTKKTDELRGEIARLKALVPSEEDLEKRQTRIANFERQLRTAKQEQAALVERLERQRTLSTQQARQLAEMRTRLATLSEDLSGKEAALQDASRRLQNLEVQLNELRQKGQALEADVRAHEETIARLQREREHQDVAYQQLKTLYAINARDTLSRLIVKYAPKYLNFAILDATGNDPVTIQYQAEEKELYEAMTQANAMDLVQGAFEDMSGKKLDPETTVFFLIIGPNTLQKFDLIAQAMKREGINVEPFALYEALESEQE